MAQTPISASVLYNSTTPTTIYTVPTGKTAVVKGVLASSLTTTYDTVTLNKVSGGTTYPLVQNQDSGYVSQSGTYYVVNGVKTINLLQSPVTLAAGDSISISTTGTSYYKVEKAVDSTTYRIGNIAYLNGNYIAVGVDNATGVGLILTSTDGITYTRRTFTPTVYLTSVTYGNGYYVVCNATGGTIHYSTDLATWTQVSLPSTVGCFAITYGGGKFVTGGSSGVCYYATTTPLSWTTATLFNTNAIYSISYIGTNYFFGVNGISYYTADFATYTQPYVSVLSSTNYYGMAAANNKFLVSNSLAPYNYPNTFLRTSTDGNTWSNQTTVANNMNNYGAIPVYAGNGGYFAYRGYNASTQGAYIYSSDGVTWNSSTYSFLTGYSNDGTTVMCAAYGNTSNSSYYQRVLIYQYSGGNNYIQSCNVSTAGVLASEQFTFTSSYLSAGSWQGIPAFAGNPYDGSWRAIGYYYSGATYVVPYYYGSNYNNGSDSQFGPGVNQSGYGYATGYGCSVGVVPNSPVYYAGTTSGWVFTASSYSAGWGLLFGNPSYVTNPAGFNWSAANNGSSAVVGFARSGDLSTSTMIIVWNNGYVAISSDQGANWTYSNCGLTGIGTQQALKFSPVAYGNGKFIVIGASGQVSVSTDGVTWTTMLSGIESAYYLNSQNVFVTNSGSIYTSATGVVNTFTLKTTNASFNTNLGSNPSTNRLIYGNSTYYILDTSSNLYSSSDLITWTSKGFNTQALNNTAYLSTGTYGGLAYSGSGTGIVASNARAAQSTNGTGSIGKVFTPNSSIYVGNATASVVQLD